mmetsp:Transcript_33566/g.99986  ORF Transcript_33566/g.99986 Transcript_33566/m.99986 type:complete len:308 (+) Transcript_33566:175-1098(+)
MTSLPSGTAKSYGTRRWSQCCIHATLQSSSTDRPVRTIRSSCWVSCQSMALRSGLGSPARARGPSCGAALSPPSSLMARGPAAAAERGGRSRGAGASKPRSAGLGVAAGAGAVVPAAGACPGPGADAGAARRVNRGRAAAAPPEPAVGGAPSRPSTGTAGGGTSAAFARACGGAGASSRVLGAGASVSRFPGAGASRESRVSCTSCSGGVLAASWLRVAPAATWRGSCSERSRTDPEGTGRSLTWKASGSLRRRRNSVAGRRAWVGQLAGPSPPGPAMPGACPEAYSRKACASGQRTMGHRGSLYHP